MFNFLQWFKQQPEQTHDIKDVSVSFDKHVNIEASTIFDELVEIIKISKEDPNKIIRAREIELFNSSREEIVSFCKNFNRLFETSLKDMIQKIKNGELVTDRLEFEFTTLPQQSYFYNILETYIRRVHQKAYLEFSYKRYSKYSEKNFEILVYVDGLGLTETKRFDRFTPENLNGYIEYVDLDQELINNIVTEMIQNV